MSKFEQYNIILKGLPESPVVKEFVLDDVFFKKIDSPEVQKGNVKAKVTIRKKENNTFELLFDLDGVILIPCDRCLDDMEQPITYKENLLVKFGNAFSEEDEMVVVPELEGAINIAWFLYEFIILNIPIKHVHQPGLCNKSMISKLKKHIARSSDDDDDENALLELDDDDMGIDEIAED
ncbi:DUF177 domain-containing protein [Paludibacter sp. 221]|uniref:YceD family protein n=1 Tax=Paludibacter sp. 221 TaxID=2302939 RepID=UPI0013D297F0|nr:DUF177 domain-containing protein [Paludibacter sp. 221]NDV45453.1 DUF177 domain-containing protein [Paludibacter sp. 221]